VKRSVKLIREGIRKEHLKSPAKSIVKEFCSETVTLGAGGTKAERAPPCCRGPPLRRRGYSGDRSKGEREEEGTDPQFVEKRERNLKT